MEPGNFIFRTTVTSDKGVGYLVQFDGASMVVAKSQWEKFAEMIRNYGRAHRQFLEWADQHAVQCASRDAAGAFIVGLHKLYPELEVHVYELDGVFYVSNSLAWASSFEMGYYDTKLVAFYHEGWCQHD